MVPGRFCGCRAGYFRRVQFFGMCGGAAPDHDGHSPRVKVELLAIAHCAPGRAEQGQKIHPPLKSRAFLDDITAFMAEKGLKKLTEEVEKTGLKLSVTENGKGRREQCNHLLQVSGEAVSGTLPQRKELSWRRMLRRWAWTLKTRTKQLDEKQEVWCEILVYQENGSCRKKYTRLGVRVLLRTGLVPRERGENKPLTSRLQEG